MGAEAVAELLPQGRGLVQQFVDQGVEQVQRVVVGQARAR
jgi:hypothetical protein